MRRRQVITGFAALSLMLAAVSLQQALQLRHRTSINKAVADVPLSLTPDQYGEQAAIGDDTLAIELQFAQASALLNGGHLDLAERSLGALAQQTDHPQLATAARFNLANGYLREALVAERASGRYRSLIELGKQRYRDLLAAQPDHRDARYNLEMALRLAPETETYEVDERGKPIKSVSVVFPGFEDRELP